MLLLTSLHAVDAYMRHYGAAGPPKPMESRLDGSCYNETWYWVKNCRKWWTNATHRFVEGNGIPDHDEHGNKDKPMGPYCPFGKGGGYCLPGEEHGCPFAGMECPQQDLAIDFHLDGDVPVPLQVYHEFPLNPDPTSDELPNHMYNGAREYQQIGVHLNGVHIKGPGEAEGYNVDTSMIPLLCGGHVTPPIGPGPSYHYHKASTCDHIEIVGDHGPLIGYANDGFGIYGFQDIDGTAPVVDECNGHFGPLSNANLTDIVYHYHAHETTTLPSMNFIHQEPSFQPYFIGCQGPSKGKCSETIAKAPEGMSDLDHNWCGVGCGFQLCVQPGTKGSDLITYLETFGKGTEWLNSYTVNNYTVCPACYRENAFNYGNLSRMDFLAKAEKRHHQQVCKICTQGFCAKCEKCGMPGKPSCDVCTSGGCLPSCNNCWPVSVVL